MGNRSSVKPPVVLDTLQDQACASTSSTEKMTSDDEDKEDEVASKDLTGDKEEYDKPPKENKGSGSAPQKSMSIGKGKGKKRKRTKAEVMEDIMAKAMTDGIKESEKMFMS